MHPTNTVSTEYNAANIALLYENCLQGPAYQYTVSSTSLLILNQDLVNVHQIKNYTTLFWPYPYDLTV